MVVDGCVLVTHDVVVVRVIDVRVEVLVDVRVVVVIVAIVVGGSVTLVQVLGLLVVLHTNSTYVGPRVVLVVVTVLVTVLAVILLVVVTTGWVVLV